MFGVWLADDGRRGGVCRRRVSRPRFYCFRHRHRVVNPAVHSLSELSQDIGGRPDDPVSGDFSGRAARELPRAFDWLVPRFHIVARHVDVVPHDRERTRGFAGGYAPFPNEVTERIRLDRF